MVASKLVVFYEIAVNYDAGASSVAQATDLLVPKVARANKGVGWRWDGVVIVRERGHGIPEFDTGRHLLFVQRQFSMA